MNLTLNGLKNCDSCRKALKTLEANGHEVTFRDVRNEAVSKVEIKKWSSGKGWEALLNTRSTTWRGLDEKEKANLTQTKAIDLMALHPALIKRPVIETTKGITIGWSKDVQEQFS